MVRVHATAKGLRALDRGRAMRIEATLRLVADLDEGSLGTLDRAVAVIEDMLGTRAAPWRSRPKSK